MTATARLLEQRSIGHVHLRMEQTGIAVMRESGSAKCRIPRGSREAILINTSGGLAGGDVVHVTAEAGENAALTLTSQAAERVYRTLGPAAEVRVRLTAAAGATLLWIPQESIFFEGSALKRSLDVNLCPGSTFLAVEPMMFGRLEMGETVKRVSVEDRWTIKMDNRLIHAEAFKLGPVWPTGTATLAGNHAAASIVMISREAPTRLEALRKVLGAHDGASAWNGKLVARLVAKDGFHLRKTLIQALCACVGTEALPKCWSF